MFPIWKSIIEKDTVINTKAIVIFKRFVFELNSFDDYLNLLKRCDEQGMGYTWYYPYGFGEEPEVPSEIKKHVQYLHI